MRGTLGNSCLLSSELCPRCLFPLLQIFLINHPISGWFLRPPTNHFYEIITKYVAKQKKERDQSNRRHIESGKRGSLPHPLILVFNSSPITIPEQLFLMVLDKSVLKSIWESKGPRITNCEEEQV